MFSGQTGLARAGRLMVAVLALSGPAGGALAQAVVTVPSEGGAPVPTLSVTGEGSVQVVPDMATVTLGVTAQAPGAAEAAQEAGKKIRAVLDMLGQQGVRPEDVQTSGLSLNPRYEQVRNDPGQSPQVAGFEASNMLTVTVRDLSKLGDLLDGVLDRGANTFRGVSFGLQDPDTASDAARKLAVADALAQATLMAGAAGAKRGPILSMSESGGGMPRPMFSAAMKVADAMPVAPGALTVQAEVTMVFRLDQ